jgi:hypothetical protein
VLDSVQFTAKCFPIGDADWNFTYPPNGLLPLRGVMSKDLIKNPDMLDANKDRYSIVVKCGNTTGTTLGRSNPVMSFTREYEEDGITPKWTTKEWCIFNYDNKSGVFSDVGDSGSVVADIQGRIGGMLTAGAGQTHRTDVSYATPFWWLLERIKASKFAATVDLNIAFA